MGCGQSLKNTLGMQDGWSCCCSLLGKYAHWRTTKLLFSSSGAQVWIECSCACLSLIILYSCYITLIEQQLKYSYTNPCLGLALPSLKSWPYTPEILLNVVWDIHILIKSQTPNQVFSQTISYFYTEQLSPYPHTLLQQLLLHSYSQTVVEGVLLFKGPMWRKEDHFSEGLFKYMKCSVIIVFHYQQQFSPGKKVAKDVATGAALLHHHVSSVRINQIQRGHFFLFSVATAREGKMRGIQLVAICHLNPSHSTV